MPFDISPNNISFLNGGGEITELLRKRDWSKTTLNNPEAWPQSLKTTLSIIFNSKFPMLLFWGPEHICFYNDAFRPCIGNEGKHPAMLGAKAKDYWKQTWEDIKPVLDNVLAVGEAIWTEDQLLPIYTNGVMEEAYWTFCYSAVHDETGKPAGVFVTCNETTKKVEAISGLKASEETVQDVSERAAVQKDIADSEIELRLALEGGNLGHFDSYPQKDILIWSPKAKELFGLAADETIDLGIYRNLIHPEDFAKAQSILSNALQGKNGEYYENEYRTIHNKWLYVKGKIRFDNKGQAERVTGIIQDITETKLANELLAASERRFSDMIYSSPSLISILKGEEFIIDIANDAILETWGKGKDIIGKPFLAVLPEIIDQGFDKILREVYQTGIPFKAHEMPVTLTRNGVPELSYYNFIYQVQKDLNGKIDSLTIIATDVTQQTVLNKKIHDSERQIKETKELLELTFSNVPAAIFLYGKNKELLLANERAAHLLNYETVETLLAKKDYTAIINAATNIFFIQNEAEESFATKDLPTTIALESTTPTEHTFSMQHKMNGAKKWLINKSSPILDADGNVLMVLTTITDITVQKIAEENIRNSEKRFRLLADDAPMWVWITDKEINVQYANLELLHFIGLSHYSEFTGQVWQSSIHEDDLIKLMNQFQKAAENQNNFEIEARIKNAKTETFEWFYLKGIPHIEEEIFTGFIGTAINIQEQKIATEILEYRRALLESNNESSLDGALLVDAKGNIISYNKRFTEIWNMPKQITDAKDDKAALEYAMSQLVNPNQFIEKVKYLYDHPTETSKDELEYKDGKIVERYGYPVIGEDGTYYAWSWIFRDITQQKNDEKLIKESETRFRVMAETLPQLIWVTDEKGNREYASGRWKEYTGLTPDVAESWEATVHPDDLDDINNKWKYSLETGEIYKHEVRLKSKTGEYRWFAVRGEPVLQGDNKIDKWVGAFTDIHTQKSFAHELETQVENRTKELATLNESLISKNESLSISESFNRALTEISPNVVYIFDIEKNIPIFLNKTALDIIGFGWEEINKMVSPIKNIVHPDDILSVKLAMLKIKTSAVGEVIEHEYRIKNSVGNWIPFLVRETAFKRNSEDQVYQVLGIGVDITELKKSKDILEQNNADLEKMNKELQSFAYISSHDLQEPLRKIQTFSNYIIDREKDNLSDKGKDYFGRMQASAARMRQLIDDLLAYSRASDTAIQFKKINLNKFINEVKGDFLDDVNFKGAIIEIEAPDNALVIPFQFRQLIANLISNSLKFKKVDVATHIVITSTTEKGSKLVDAKMNEQKNYCHIKFTDNGIGFDNRYSEKIFEVFQRLHGKSEYEGTGIGLAIVKKIVDNHHGIIKATSDNNEGAVFDIYLPQ